ncbi:SMP-LTD domain-containing protein [Entamoeba marina]
MFWLCLAGFILGFLPIIIILLFFYSFIPSNYLKNYNLTLKADIENKRLVDDIVPPLSDICLPRQKVQTTFSVDIYFDKLHRDQPSHSNIVFENTHLFIVIDEEEYCVPFSSIDDILVDDKLFTEGNFNFHSLSDIQLVSASQILPNHCNIFLHFQTPKQLENFGYRLISYIHPQQLSNFDQHFTKLLSYIHSLKQTESVQWFYGTNYLVHRIFFTFHNNTSFLNLIRSVIQQKIMKANKPSFLEEIVCQNFTMGPSLPIFSDPHVNTIDSPNKTLLEAAVHYINGFEMKFYIKIKVLFGSITLNPIVRLKELHSIARIMVQEYPTSIIWFGFVSEPQFKLQVDFSSLKNQSFTDKIQNKLEEYFVSFVRKQIIESYVAPYMKSFELPTHLGDKSIKTTDNKIELLMKEIPTATSDYERHKKMFKKLEEEKLKQFEKKESPLRSKTYY